jgi:hypothetical protein
MALRMLAQPDPRVAFLHAISATTYRVQLAVAVTCV